LDAVQGFYPEPQASSRDSGHRHRHRLEAVELDSDVGWRMPSARHVNEAISSAGLEAASSPICA